MSHPNKKRPEDRRDKRHELLLTEAEMKRYRDKATAAGVSVNEWVRHQVVLADYAIVVSDVEDPTTHERAEGASR